MRKFFIFVVLFGVVGSARAETMYVTDRLATGLRATFADDSPLIKTVEVGTSLEVIERVDKFAHVRDGQGAEGWIDVRYLVSAVPAKTQLERLQAELAKSRKELSDAQSRVKELEANLATQGSSASGSPPAAEKPSETTNSGSAPTTDTGSGIDWGWIVLAFAMLWLGFGAGVVWLRERHRKKLGGMYLRI